MSEAVTTGLQVGEYPTIESICKQIDAIGSTSMALIERLQKKRDELRAENTRMRYAINKTLEHAEDPDVERVGAQCTLCYSYRKMLRESLTATRSEPIMNGPMSFGPSDFDLLPEDGKSADQDVARVKQMITALPLDAQKRVMVIVGILRNLLEADEAGEVELAFTLVLSELAARK